MAAQYTAPPPAFGSGAVRNRYAPPPPLSWWARHPHLATVVIALALVMIGMGLERLTQ